MISPDTIIGIFLVILFAGWPLVAFVHYHLRRGYPVSRSLALTVAPTLGAILIDVLFGDGFVGRRHQYDWLGFLFVLLGIIWVALPWLFLLVWSLREYSHRRRPPQAVIHTPKA